MMAIQRVHIKNRCQISQRLRSPRQPLYENHAPPYAPMEALTLAPPTPTPKSPLGVGVGVEPIYVARNGAAFKVITSFRLFFFAQYYLDQYYT